MTKIDKVNWYLEAIKNEIDAVSSNNYYGSINIEINFVAGNIVGSNVSSTKSIKFSCSEK